MAIKRNVKYPTGIDTTVPTIAHAPAIALTEAPLAPMTAPIAAPVTMPITVLPNHDAPEYASHARKYLYSVIRVQYALGD